MKLRIKISEGKKLTIIVANRETGKKKDCQTRKKKKMNK